MKPDVIEIAEKIRRGEISRNRQFELFKTEQVVRARTTHARVQTMLGMLQSGSWSLEAAERRGSKRELLLVSDLLSATYRATLDHLEWEYLCRQLTVGG